MKYCYRIGGKTFVDLHERIKLFLKDNSNVKIIAFSAYISAGKHCAFIIVEDMSSDDPYEKVVKTTDSIERMNKPRERNRGFSLNRLKNHKLNDNRRKDIRHQNFKDKGDESNSDDLKNENRLRERFKKYRSQSNSKDLDEEIDDGYYNYKRNNSHDSFRKKHKEDVDEDDDLDDEKYPSYRRR